MTQMPAIKTIFMRWLQRSSLIALMVFTLIALTAFATTYFVLDTERGSRWALQMAQRLLPSLSIADAKGTLLQGLRVETIRWRDTDVDVELEQTELQLRFSALLHGEIRLEKLSAKSLRIAPQGPSSDEPIALPRLFLPFTLSVADLALQNLDIVDNGATFTLHDLRSAVRWRATTLQFTQTQMHWRDMALRASGNIGFRGDYPLQLKGQLTLPARAQSIALRTQGNLRKLQLQATAPAPYALTATAQLATLDANLPLQVHAELLQPLAQTFGEDRIEISRGRLDAHGDLTRIEGTVALLLNDSRYGASKLDISAQWQSDSLQTQMSWQPNGGSLQLQCATDLHAPISTNCSGNAGNLSLTPWLGDQTGSVSSTIKIDARWLDPQWSFALVLPDIAGQFNSDTLAANLDLRTDDGTVWQLLPSLLRIGPNEVKGSGEFGQRTRLQLAINARDLHQLHAQAAGAIAGTISLEGDMAAPTMRVQLKGNRLQFADARATQVNLNLVLPRLGNDTGRGLLDVQSLALGESAPFNLTLSLSGDRLQQRWGLNAAQERNRLALQCTTRSDGAFDNWQLNCPELSGHIRSAVNFDWRNTVALNARAQLAPRQFELAPFCLRGDDTELCLEQALRYADGKIRPVSAHAHGIPLRWLEPWLPDAFTLVNDARVSAQAQLSSVTPLRAQANADIAQTRWRWHTATSTETTAINAIHVDASLDDQRAFIATSAQSPTIGRIDTQLAIHDPRTQRTLDGRVDIVQLQLAGLAWAFQGLDAISGEINGSIAISGRANAPRLHGQLLLKDGNALWAPLGAPFRSVHADLTFDNNSAKLGGWFALGAGGGDIDGALHWDDTENNWQLQLGLIAGGLSAMPLPNSTVVFSPHVQLNAAPHEVHIDGYVDIASADIRLKELPPATTDISQDQEIVGQHVDESAWKLWSNLGLNLGDQFHLNGFGADVNLSGRLQLSQAPGDNTHLRGEVKVPRGRYRAYGQRLSVRKGSVIFYGPLDNPDLNLEAVRDMPPGVTDVVGLRVIGSLKTPEAILFSEPAMPDSDIAYYLLSGRKPVASSNGSSAYSASGALLSLGLAGSESRAGQLAEKFGITDLQLGTAESKNGQSEAEVSGQLGKDLFVRYGRGLGQQSNSISFQYRLTPKLMIETISGVDDALDLLYSFEIK